MMNYNHTIIIAEAGVNHNGDMELAKKLIQVAAEAGVDYVKFQTFKTEKLVSKDAKQADYQQHNLKSTKGSSQFDMLKKLELDEDKHHFLIEECKKNKVKFLSTAFDLESIKMLCELNIDFFKIPSGEVTNKPYLEAIAKTGLPVILSTGMCNMDEISASVEVLIDNGVSKDDLTILHCNTQYPTPLSDVNLLAMNAIRDELKVNVGYSDHTLGIEVPIAAVALGATVIEKHFTLDNNLPGPDHKASLEPHELMAMVNAIRKVEKFLGKPIKIPSSSEKPNISAARKSIHLAKTLSKGEIITYDHLIMVRPGDGISPMKYNTLVGKHAKDTFPIGHKLSGNDFE
ncbi:MAG: N,N'-diacetyllegionaminate synthase [Sphingobacteriales bacterium]|jgi:N,N'-diacetyllegionaminate synthase